MEKPDAVWSWRFGYVTGHDEVRKLVEAMQPCVTMVVDGKELRVKCACGEPATTCRITEPDDEHVTLHMCCTECLGDTPLDIDASSIRMTFGESTTQLKPLDGLAAIEETSDD